MKNALESVNRYMPYNSFGMFLVNEGRNYPEEFGGNCVQQCMRLAAKLRAEEYLVKFVKGVTHNGITHFALLCEADDQIYYLDPFLLQTDPINITQCLQAGVLGRSKAHPVTEEGSSMVELVPTGDTSFEVTLVGRSQAGKPVRIHTYPYDLELAFDELPDLDIDELQHRQKKLVMRILEPSGSVTSLSLYHQTGFMDVSNSSRGLERVRMRYETDEFMRKCEALSRIMNRRTHEILSFFYEGFGVYTDLFEPGSIYPNGVKPVAESQVSPPARA